MADVSVRTGNPPGRPPIAPIDRFWTHVSFDTNECWSWTARLDKDGYGYFNVGHGSREQRAHRFAYTTFVGPIPDGLVLDHLCRNRRCVNPAHLEAVTVRENVIRAGRVRTANVTHCPHGHAYDEANTYVHPIKGGRVCRACRTANERLRRMAAA